MIDYRTCEADCTAETCMCEPVRHGLESLKMMQPTAPKNNVNLPSHYAQFKHEPIRFIVENLGADFMVGNIIKYVLRRKLKNGNEDVRKVLRYAEMLYKFEVGDPNWWMVDADYAEALEANLLRAENRAKVVGHVG